MVELSEQALYYTVYCLPGLSPFHSYEWCLCYVSVYVRPQCRKWDLALIFAQAALVINSSVPSWVPKAITAGLMEHIAQWWVEQRCSWQSLQASTWVCICCCQWMGCHPASHKVRNTWLLVWLITPATLSQCHDGTSTCSSLDELLQDDGQQSMVDLAALIAKHRE